MAYSTRALECGASTPEVLTTRRVRAPGMGNTWKSFEKVQSPGLEATLLCKASPGHEYTPQAPLSLADVCGSSKFALLSAFFVV